MYIPTSVPRVGTLGKPIISKEICQPDSKMTCYCVDYLLFLLLMQSTYYNAWAFLLGTTISTAANLTTILYKVAYLPRVGTYQSV